MKVPRGRHSTQERMKTSEQAIKLIEKHEQKEKEKGRRIEMNKEK